MAEPARWGLRRNVLDVMDRLRLARPAVQLYEAALAAKARRPASDGALPLPPARLRAQVGPAHADAEEFLRSGRRHAELVRELLREQGRAVEELGALLDWGCGCGRVLRHWVDLTETRVHGCDVNPRMVEWCNANLPFAHVVANELEPPLPHEDASVDLVYAFSVITHLPEELQHAWVAECRRLLRPGGHLLVSTLGERYLELGRLTGAELAAFRAGELVVLYERSPGTSLCSAYHPPEYVHGKLAAGFEVVDFRPAVDFGGHDIHLLRKPA